MDNAGEQIIQQLRQKVEQEAQRKSEKLKLQAISTLTSNSENTNVNKPVSTNIFNNLKKPDTINLFGGQRKSVNLFQIKPSPQSGLQNGGEQPSKNIFNIQQKPAVAQDDQNDDKDSKSDGDQGEAIQSQRVFKTQPDVKVMKYEYKNELTKIFQMGIKKFKSGVSIAKQQIYVSLEKLPNQPSTLYLLVRSNTTKVLVYQGIMMKNISKLEHFMNKPDNLKFDILKKNPNPEIQSPKMIKEVVKMQFQSEEQCQQFKKVVDNYFSSANQ